MNPYFKFLLRENDMIKVYEASNGVEAKLILDLLTNAGLSSRIDGEYLQGGIGDLQASGLIRVMINESEYTQGKTLINQWKNNEFDIPEDFELENKEHIQDAINSQNSTIQPSYNKTLNFLTIALLAFLVGVIATTFYYRSPVTENGIDYDGDNIPDEWFIYKGQLVSETRSDRNLDKTIDIYYFYDHHGMIESMKSDDNFDGVFESESKFENGNILWTKVDTTGDGSHNYRMYFKFGVLNSIDYYDSETQQKIKIDYFKSLALHHSIIDTNDDGILDSQVEYDDYGNAINTILIK